MDEDLRLDQFLALSETKFRISDLLLRFDGVLINGIQIGFHSYRVNLTNLPPGIGNGDFFVNISTIT